MSAHKNHVFMSIAHELSRLGTCDRKQVGAVIVRDGRCITWGYNGAPPGMPHCEENSHGWNPLTATEHSLLCSELRVDEGLRDDELSSLAVSRWGCKNATHAEANALAFAARQGISTDGATLYVTVSPCETCSRLIIAAGIREVIWDEEYRDRSGIELLWRTAGIFARHINVGD